MNPKNNVTLPVGSQVNLQLLLNNGQANSLLELWRNGELIGEMPGVKADQINILNVPWEVQVDPTTLTFLLITPDGEVAVSNAVTIYSSEPIAGQSEILSSPGDTRQKLAETYGIPVANVRIESLPDYDVDTEIPPQTPVLLVAPLDATEIPSGTFLPDGFSALIPEESSAIAPVVSGFVEGNTVKISLSVPSEEIKSVVLYRSTAISGEYLPILIKPVEELGQGFIMEDQIDELGVYSYFVMGVTENDLQPGNIIQPDLSGINKHPGLANVIPTDDGQIKIMEGVGTVYFYASINHSQSVRVPEKGFYPITDGKVNLNDAMSMLIEDAEFPLWVDLEVWTWTGKTAELLGIVHTWLEVTNLAVCVDAGQRCGGIGTGEFYSRELTEAVANTDIPGGTDFDFPWKTSMTSNPEALVQISLMPFPDQSEVQPEDLVYSSIITGQCTDYGCGSVFNIEFSNLLDKPSTASLVLQNYHVFSVDSSQDNLANPAQSTFRGDFTQQLLNKTVFNSNDQLDMISGGLQRGSLSLYPIDFYVRVMPTQNEQPSGTPSNTVHVLYGSMGVSPTIEYYPTVSPPEQPPQIYTARLIEFNPPIPPTRTWGCVKVTNVEPGTINGGFYKYYMDHNEPLCPAVYKGEGEPSWYESLWDFATGAVDWISEKYAALKSAVASEIAGFLDDAGICNDCEAYITAALNAGLIAMGIPPELPDFSKLSDAGIDYLVSEVASGMGVPCDSTCQEILRDGINKLSDEMKAQVVTSYMNEDEAHNHGYEPLNIPPGVSVEPALESNWQMATLRIQISRKPGTENITPTELSEIESALYVTFDGYNDRTGQSYTVYNCFTGGCDLINPSPDCQAVAVPGCPESRVVTAPLEGQLFKPYIFTLGSDVLPHLQPGESKELNLVLIPSVYWIPGHEVENTYSWYDDWGYLYEGGIGKLALDITAESCNKNISGYPPSCSYTLERTDYWEMILPDTSTYGFNQMWSTK